MGRALLCCSLLVIITAARAAPRPTGAGAPPTAVPPLIQALTALRAPAPLNSSFRSTSVLAVTPDSSSSLPAAGIPLETLRPAAAAALSRQGTPAAALSDDDIVAINVLLGREGPASSPYCYDTGLATERVPMDLLTFGNYTPKGSKVLPSRRNSSMQSRERLQRLSSLGPLSWLARSYVVTGDELLELRITQMLQLILEDAICDSLASAANLPPNQVVTFAAANLTLSLGFRGVDWDDGIPTTATTGTKGASAAGPNSATAAAAANLPHKGLLAVKKAMQELTGNFDPDHITVSMEALPRPRGSPRSTAAAVNKKQRAAGAAGPAANAQAPTLLPPSAANTAHRKLLQQQQQGLVVHSSSSSSSHDSSGSHRQLHEADGAPELQVVYVRLHGMGPMNLTSLFEKLGSCVASPVPTGLPPVGLGGVPSGAAVAFRGAPTAPFGGLLEAGEGGGPQSGPITTALQGPGSATAAAATPGRMPQLPAGTAFTAACADTFRRHLQQQGVRVSSGPAFSVAPWEAPAAAIGLSVAVGITRGQQITTDPDPSLKASTWLNSTALQAILGTFNLTVASGDADFVAFLRDRESGSFPALPGLNLTDLIPSLFEAVMAAGSNLTQQGGQSNQQQQQGGLLPGASAALNKGILAGIIVAVVASVMALVGVAVLLLRRRGDSSTDSKQQPGEQEDAAANRRRRRRPRMYHAKYLPNTGPVLGPDALATPGVPAGPMGAAAAAGTSAAAAAAGGSSAGGSAGLPRSTLERGDSVMSQVDLELEDAEAEGDQSSEVAGSTTSLVQHVATQQQQQQQGVLPPQQGLQKPGQQKQLQLERLQGAAGSSGSSSKQQLLAGMHRGSSSAACSEVMAPAESSNWDDQGSVSTHTLSAGLTANSSSQLSPWTSSSDAWQGCTPPAGQAVQQQASATGGTAGAKLHRLATASQAAQVPTAAAGASSAEMSAGSGSSSNSSVTSRHVAQAGSSGGIEAGGQGGEQHGHQQQQELKGARGRQGVAATAPAAAPGAPAAAAPATAAGSSSFSMASAFAAMDAQLAAAGARAGGAASAGGASSDGGSSNASAKAVQPLGRSCWHKEGHESGFLVPGTGAAAEAGGSGAVQGARRSGGGLVSPFAAAVQLAYSVASDEIA